MYISMSVAVKPLAFTPKVTSVRLFEYCVEGVILVVKFIFVIDICHFFGS